MAKKKTKKENTEEFEMTDVMDDDLMYEEVTIGMKLKPRSWDEDYKADIESGLGFDIDDPNGINKNNVRSERGIYSPLFGGDLSEDSQNDQYRCACKDGHGLVGKFYFDEKNPIICPRCNQPVTYKNTDMEKTGWITLREDIHLINPLYYFILEKIIGKKNLNNIIYYNKKRDEDGNVVVDMDHFDENNPYFNIGMIEFYNRFDEIIDYYKETIKGTPALKEEKLENYEFLKENKDKIFVNHLPVYTLLLRPILMIKNNMIYATINAKYQSLLVKITNLNKVDTAVDTEDLKVLPLLFSSQLILNDIHKITIEEQISGKEGHIRSSMLGERVNFSSRCVIVPLNGRYNLDEIKIPYLVFLELYKFEIINLLRRMDNLTVNEAINRWNQGIEKFDKRIYMIMNLLINETKGGLWCFINRNPSLNYGSLLTMRVVEVKEDYDDLTLSIPLNVLGLLAADFDGDVINLISIKTREFADHYNKIFNPQVMMIDRNDGKFNRKMNLIKDQMIGLYSFCKD